MEKDIRELTDSEEEIVKALQSTPRYLPVWYRYNPLGSKFCYECSQSEAYYPTLAEKTLVENHAEKILKAISSTPGENGKVDTKHVNIIELGAGFAAKTRHVLNACIRQGISVKYFPIDLDEDTLRKSCDSLQQEYNEECIEMCPIGGFYSDGLVSVANILSEKRETVPIITLVLFLGNSYGNLPAPDQIELLHNIRKQLSSLTQLYLLIGVDMTQNEEILERAYGRSNPTATNLQMNGLRRLAEDFQTDIDLDDFVMEVKFHKTKQHNFLTQTAVAKKQTIINLKKAGIKLEIKEGEVIRLSEGKNTNSKWSRQQWQSHLDECQFQTETSWSITNDGIDYALCLLKPK